MGRAARRGGNMGGQQGLAACLMALALVLAACGEVTTNEDAGLCTQAVCDDGKSDDGCGPGGAAKSRCKKNGKEAPAADAGMPLVPAPTDVIVPPCTVCARAENCCKAEGMSDCNYAVACAEAKPAEQQAYLALCRAVLEDHADGKSLPDACVF